MTNLEKIKALGLTGMTEFLYRAKRKCSITCINRGEIGCPHQSCYSKIQEWLLQDIEQNKEK